jgi:hypothetical protein
MMQRQFLDTGQLDDMDPFTIQVRQIGEVLLAVT